MFAESSMMKTTVCSASCRTQHGAASTHASNRTASNWSHRAREERSLSQFFPVATSGARDSSRNMVAVRRTRVLC